MASVSAFYTNSEDAINQRINDVVRETNLQNIDEVYEVERCVAWITKFAFSRVCGAILNLLHE